MSKIKRTKLIFLPLIAVVTLLYIACPEDTGPAAGPPKFTCQNGTPIDGTPSDDVTIGCQACNDGFLPLDGIFGTPGTTCVPAFPYVCDNGTPIVGNNTDVTAVGCQICNDGFLPQGGALGTPGTSCVAGLPYTCDNGTPIDDLTLTPNSAGCQTCNVGFALSAAAPGPDVACQADSDGDTVADTLDNCPNTPNPAQAITMGETAGHACNTDIDDDDDGLIEIWTLEQLHNVRHNLTGTTYDDEDEDTGTGDAGVTTGAPTAATADCTTPTNGVYLCGYELAQDLDFDLDRDGSTYTGTAPAITLDADDAATPHFVTTAGGWEPIADNAMFNETNRFNAIFEGNGYTISNLAVQRSSTWSGFFGIIGANGHVRNVNLVDAIVVYTGTATTNVYVGGLAGQQSGGSIIASSASGTIVGGSGGTDYVGGLVGGTMGGTIIASYAAGSVNGAAGGDDSAGGLVGLQQNGIIIASYAAGDADGGGGDSDNTGGLIGEQSGGRVIASYATGDTDGGGGDSDNTGGLIGEQSGGITVASYAAGNADGGTGDTDSTGALVGAQTLESTSAASYGFGNAVGENTGITPALPTGVTTAADLTAANTPGCDNPALTTEATCTAARKVPGEWTPGDKGAQGTCAAPSGATSGITYPDFTTRITCVSTGTWTDWNNASADTLDAWIFTQGSTPTLRYADYDGSTGTDYLCSLFPTTLRDGGITIACGDSGTPLPGQ